MKLIKIDNHKELGHRFWSISDTNQLITYRCLSIFIDFDRVSELSICYVLVYWANGRSAEAGNKLWNSILKKNSNDPVTVVEFSKQEKFWGNMDRNKILWTRSIWPKFRFAFRIFPCIKWNGIFHFDECELLKETKNSLRWRWVRDSW